MAGNSDGAYLPCARVYALWRRIAFFPDPVLIGACLLLSGCGRTAEDTACAVTPIDPARQPVALAQADPDSLAAYWRQWHAGDARTALFTALAAQDAEARRAGLWEAHRRRPEDSLPLWFLGLATWQERPLPSPDRDPWEALLLLNPENGVVELATALRRAERGDIPEARMLFHGARGFPQGHAYTAVAESRLTAFLSDTRRLTGTDIGAARKILARAPLPPYRDWLDGLARVFLNPLKDHPFDIRMRGWEASQGLRRLGRRLAVQAREHPGWSGLNRGEEALGMALEWRARQFLRVYQETFPEGPHGIPMAAGVQAGSPRQETRLETDLGRLLATFATAGWPGSEMGKSWGEWNKVLDSARSDSTAERPMDFTGHAGPDSRLRETSLFRKLARSCPESRGSG